MVNNPREAILLAHDNSSVKATHGLRPVRDNPQAKALVASFLLQELEDGVDARAVQLRVDLVNEQTVDLAVQVVQHVPERQREREVDPLLLAA